MKHDDLSEEILQRTTVHRAHILELEEWQVRLPNGKTALRDIVTHHGAAAVVPVDAEGNVYLVQQFRVPFAQVTCEIPAGKLDSPTESTLLCAQRELREETGFSAEQWTLLTEVLPTPGYCSEKIGLYLAQGLTAGENRLDEDEFLHCIRMPLHEAVQRVMHGELPDAKTALGILMAARVYGI